MPLIHFFLRKRIFTFAALVATVAIGVGAYRNLQIETNPDIAVPIIYATFIYPGAAPEEVESQVAEILDQKVGECDAVEKIETFSWENIGIALATFQFGTDPEKAYSAFREKINEAKPLLPPEVREPDIGVVSFANLPLLLVGVTQGRNGMDLHRTAEAMRSELETIRGVRVVEPVGLEATQVEIALEPEELEKIPVESIRGLVDRINDFNVNMPGGSMKLGDAYFSVRTMGRFKTLDELRDLILHFKEDGEPVRFSDVAVILKNKRAAETTVRINGKPGVILFVAKETDYPSVEVTREVREAIEKYQGVEILLNKSKLVMETMKTLRYNAIAGAALVAVSLLLFLGLRPAILISFSLPLSLLITFVAMSETNISLNIVSIFALILCLGMVVDNNIVLYENIFRHLRGRKNAEKAVWSGVTEVAAPILASTLTTVAAFLPLLLLKGVVGEFTAPIPKVAVYSIVSSFLVAMIFSPLLGLKFLKAGDSAAGFRRHDAPGRLMKAYLALLEMWIRKPWRLAALLAFMLAAGLAVLPFVGVELFPQIDTSKFYVDISAPPGSSLEDTDHVASKLEDLLLRKPEVSRVIANVGSTGRRIEVDDIFRKGPSKARLVVILKDAAQTGKSHRETVDELKSAIGAERFSAKVEVVEKNIGPPSVKPVNMALLGDNMETMLKLKEEIVKRLETVESLEGIADTAPHLINQVHIAPNTDGLARAGLTTRDLGGLVFLGLQGMNVGKITVGDERLDLSLRLASMNERTAAELSQLRLRVGGEKSISVSSLTKIEMARGYSDIEHENGRRRIMISADVKAGLRPSHVVKKAQEALAGLDLPSGYQVVNQNENAILDRVFSDLRMAMGLSLLMIYLILMVEFKSTLQPLIILSSVPLALIGVLLGLGISGQPFGTLSFIALVCLSGIVVNNAIVLIDAINKRRAEGMGKIGAVLEAARIRVRPILLTEITTVLGMLPLALGRSQEAMFWKPLCWSLISGLIVATVLTLVAVPTLYCVVDNMRTAYYRNKEFEENGEYSI